MILVVHVVDLRRAMALHLMFAVHVTYPPQGCAAGGGGIAVLVDSLLTHTPSGACQRCAIPVCHSK